MGINSSKDVAWALSPPGGIINHSIYKHLTNISEF
jgi:hypothetical protein